MRLTYFTLVLLLLFMTSCKKTDDRPQSKTDYLSINFAVTPSNVIQGQAIVSRVNCGFYEHSADITFLGFEVKEGSSKHYEIRAKAFYDYIQYEISLPVVSTFDTTLMLQTPAAGQYILKFYSLDKLVQSDTVQVN